MGEILARLTHGRREHDALGGDLPKRGLERSGASLAAGTDGRVPATHDVLQVREVHVHAEGQRRVASRESRGRDENVVSRVDAEPTEVLGDRRSEVAASLDRGEALEGIAAVAVVLGCVEADLLRELFGELDEPGTRRGLGRQLERHGDLRPSDGLLCAISVRYARRK